MALFTPPAPAPAAVAAPTAAANQPRAASREGERGKLVYLAEAAD